MNANKEQDKSTDAKKTDVENAGLSGQVKQLKQICYKARRRYNVTKGKVQHSHGSGDEQNYSTFYNEKGNKTEEQVFWSMCRIKRMYNHQGLLVEEIHFYLNGDVMDDTANAMSKTVIKYDDRGNELERIGYDSQGNIQSEIFNKWDDNPRLRNYAGKFILNEVIGHGNNIESIGYFAGKSNGKQTMKFNDKGLMLESASYDTMGLLTGKNLWSYDDYGNVLEINSYNSKNELLSNTVNKYKYNKEGFKTEYTTHTYKAGILTQRSEFKCNEFGDINEAHHFDADDNPTGDYYSTPEYDEEGKLINPWEHDNEEKLKSETEEFEYDHHGNWIKKTTFYGATGDIYKKVPVHLYLREISYWGEENANQTSMEQFFADIKIQHDEEYKDDIKEEETDNEETKQQQTMKTKLTAEQAQWLIEGSVSPDTFNYMRYYTLVNNEAPSVVTYTGPYIEALALYNELTDNLDAKEIHSFRTDWNTQGETLVNYTLIFPENPGYLIHANQIGRMIKDEFEVPAFITEHEHYDENDDYLYTSQIQLLRPSEASGKRGKDGDAEEREFENELEEYINKCILKKKPDRPTINIVEVSGNSFAMVEHAIDDDFVIKDLNLNYGEGFKTFHNELMQRFNTETKGLVLFHGEPGTGKTYYIRHLLRQMTSGNKVVVYMPPNMVEYLVEPNFMTFLHGEIAEWSEEGQFCVLLIEDAEPLLALRQVGVRVQGITNLLNMSDGLLNDVLNIQIICTFNVELEKLDEALLRPGRLIARKEFKRLPEFEANLLAQRLGIKHHFTAPATLAEIYDKLKNKNILVHDADEHNDA
jgi:hypothetical protein